LQQNIPDLSTCVYPLKRQVWNIVKKYAGWLMSTSIPIGSGIALPSTLSDPVSTFGVYNSC
jgi:hypothetical protein